MLISESNSGLAVVRDDRSALMKEVERYCRYLRAENKSPRTLEGYIEAVGLLDRFLAASGAPRDAALVTRDQIAAFIQDQMDRLKASSALNRYRSLNAFFNWLEAEGEVERSPMARMHAPKVEADPPPVLSRDTILKLFKACEGAGFRERRDMAIIRLLLDTGLRREEFAAIKMADVDLDQQELRVRVKGNRLRVVGYQRKAARDLDRYLRTRERHKDAALPWLWLAISSRSDHITGSGIYQIIEYRANLVGLGRIKPHQFRHSFAHYFREQGGQEDDLMQLGGWRSREMVRRYGSQLADQRAKEAHRQMSPGDMF